MRFDCARGAKKNEKFESAGRSLPKKEGVVLFVLQKVIKPKSGDHRPENAQCCLDYRKCSKKQREITAQNTRTVLFVLQTHEGAVPDNRVAS